MRTTTPAARRPWSATPTSRARARSGGPASRTTRPTDPTTLTHLNASGTPLVRYGYGYDASDRTTSESRLWASGSSTDSLTYAYTDDGQLASATHSNSSFADETFGYDANGNRNTSGYSTGTGNRTSTDGVYNYAYDDEGNTTSKTEIATGDQTVYSWDHRNRLTEVDHKDGATTTVLATFTYDALDRRIGETAGSSVRRTLYDGYSPVLDFNGSGTQVARYLQSLDGVVARETSGGVAWYLPDRLGTVRDLADGSGAVIDHVDYGAFGGVISESSPAAGDRLVGFARLERDTATGLNLAIHRAQDPATGRWLSEDPIGFSANDANLHRYCHSLPTSTTDPGGLQAIQKKRPPLDRVPLPKDAKPIDPATFKKFDPKNLKTLTRYYQALCAGLEEAEQSLAKVKNPTSEQKDDLQYLRDYRKWFEAGKLPVYQLTDLWKRAAVTDPVSGRIYVHSSWFDYDPSTRMRILLHEGYHLTGWLHNDKDKDLASQCSTVIQDILRDNAPGYLLFLADEIDIR